MNRLLTALLPLTLALSMPPGQVAAQTPAKIEPDKMYLPDKWIPHNIHSRKEHIESLAFYSRKTLSMTQGSPDTIWGHVTWLMPLADAVKGLPAGTIKLKIDSAARPSFPDGVSFHAWRLPGEGAYDEGERFDQIIFLVDAAERVISLQLTQENPKNIEWGKGWDGERNPYYNFLYDRFNAQAGRNVRFKITSVGTGVVRLKLVLPFQKESNHWFLTAPLAEKFIVIEEAVRAGGKPMAQSAQITSGSKWKGRSNSTDTNGYRDQASIKGHISSVQGDTFVLSTSADNGARWDWTFLRRDQDIELIKFHRQSAAKGIKNPLPPTGITGNGKADDKGIRFQFTWPQPQKRLVFSGTFELKPDP
jgi:hypothetical protein